MKRNQALRRRNLTRDSQSDGAPMVHQAFDDKVLSEAVFVLPIGHRSDASENPGVWGRATTAVVPTAASLVPPDADFTGAPFHNASAVCSGPGTARGRRKARLPLESYLVVELGPFQDTALPEEHCPLPGAPFRCPCGGLPAPSRAATITPFYRFQKGIAPGGIMN